MMETDFTSRWGRALAILAMLASVLETPAEPVSPVGEGLLGFGPNGITQLRLNGSDVPVLYAPAVSVRYLDGENDGTGREVYPPNVERKLQSQRFDLGSTTHELIYPWGSATIAYRVGPGRIDADVTLRNTGQKTIFSGDISLFTFVVPREAYVGHRRHNLDGVAQSICTWPQGSISLCTRGSERPLQVQMHADDGPLRRANVDLAACRGVTVRLHFGGYTMPYDEQYLIRPLAPGASDTYRVSLRFGASGGDVFGAAQDLRAGVFGGRRCFPWAGRAQRRPLTPSRFWSCCGTRLWAILLRRPSAPWDPSCCRR